MDKVINLLCLMLRECILFSIITNFYFFLDAVRFQGLGAILDRLTTCLDNFHARALNPAGSDSLWSGEIKPTLLIHDHY